MRKALTVLSLFVILVCGIFSVGYAYDELDPTYDGTNIDVVDLYNDPDNYTLNDAGGVAEIIVKENLEKTRAANNVAAVVFDFRGFDTIGESFILLTAIAGTYVILNGYRKPKKEDERGEA